MAHQNLSLEKSWKLFWATRGNYDKKVAHQGSRSWLLLTTELASALNRTFLNVHRDMMVAVMRCMAIFQVPVNIFNLFLQTQCQSLTWHPFPKSNSTWSGTFTNPSSVHVPIILTESSRLLKEQQKINKVATNDQ